jgi:hypothetical protein
VSASSSRAAGAELFAIEAKQLITTSGLGSGGTVHALPSKDASNQSFLKL